MTPGALEEMALQHRRARLREAELERLAAPARAHRPRRNAAGRAAASIGQLLATRRELVAR